MAFKCISRQFFVVLGILYLVQLIESRKIPDAYGDSICHHGSKSTLQLLRIGTANENEDNSDNDDDDNDESGDGGYYYEEGDADDDDNALAEINHTPYGGNGDIEDYERQLQKLIQAGYLQELKEDNDADISGAQIGNIKKKFEFVDDSTNHDDHNDIVDVDDDARTKKKSPWRKVKRILRRQFVKIPKRYLKKFMHQIGLKRQLRSSTAAETIMPTLVALLPIKEIATAQEVGILMQGEEENKNYGKSALVPLIKSSLKANPVIAYNGATYPQKKLRWGNTNFILTKKIQYE